MTSTLAKGTVDISFMVPCYNEEKNVEKALETIWSAMVVRSLTYEILIIDDGSVDNTSVVVRAYQTAHPDFPIRLHRNDSNQGLGASYFEGAELTRGQYYMIVNGDGDMSAESLSKIIDRIGEADIISPYVTNHRQRPFTRRVVSRLFKKLVDLLGGHRLRYYNGPVLHRRMNIVEAETRTRGFGYQAELLCLLLKKGCSVLEVPYASVYSHHQTDAFRWSNILSVLASLYRIFLARLKR